MEKIAFERFETSFHLVGFGSSPVEVGKVTERLLACAGILGIRIREIGISRGELRIAGESDPEKTKGAIIRMARVIDASRAPLPGLVAPSPAFLPRSAEEAS